MDTFKQFLLKQEKIEKILLYEHEIYKSIPGTKKSYRQDSENTNTMIQKHSHIYAKPKGGGKELYAVNIDGSGHDGSSGIEIPFVQADYLRSIGYDINSSNILESMILDSLNKEQFSLVIFV